jgi:hypothetical protein
LNMLRQRHVNMPLTMTKLVMGCTILVWKANLSLVHFNIDQKLRKELLK